MTWLGWLAPRSQPGDSMFSRYRKEYVTVKEFNEHLKYCKRFRLIHHRAKTVNETFALNAFLEDKEVEVRLSYKKGTRACTYICHKDGREEKQKVDGGEAFRILSQYYKVPRFTDETILGMSASPLLWKNKKFENTRQKAIGYDLNSAYSAAMLKDMPDTSVPPQAKQIGKNEIGFIEMPTENGGMSLVPKFKGFSLWVFPLMKSPFTKFVEKWYDKKLDEKTKDKAKGVLNYSVGYLQKVNPFLRATIIGYCNELIKSYITEDTLYCNTDSIITTKPIPELTIGTGIGEWKVEHEGMFAFKGFNYQWDYKAPHFRGISRKWFPKDWDILKDKLPTCGNLYEIKDYKLVERMR